jgi:hypothetical protein
MLKNIGISREMIFFHTAAQSVGTLKWYHCQAPRGKPPMDSTGPEIFVTVITENNAVLYGYF